MSSTNRPKWLTPRRNAAICTVLVLIGMSYRIPQIMAGDWNTNTPERGFYLPWRFTMSHPRMTVDQVKRLELLQAQEDAALARGTKMMVAFRNANAPEIEYLRGLNAGYYMAPQEITIDQWHEALTAVPVTRWYRDHGVETFTQSEPYSAQLYERYVCAGGRYWKMLAHPHETVPSMVRRVDALKAAQRADEVLP